MPLVPRHILIEGSSESVYICTSVYMPGEAPLHVVVLAVPVQQGALHLAHQHLGRAGQARYRQATPGCQVQKWS